MRPLWYEFPNNPELFDIDSEFLLGPGILVKPITHVRAGSSRAQGAAGTDNVWENV